MPPQLIPALTAIANTVDRHSVQIASDHRMIVLLLVWNTVLTLLVAAVFLAWGESKNSK